MKNFLLLGKKSILIAQYPEAALKLAWEKYRAVVIASQETQHAVEVYFGKSVSLAAH